MEQSRQFSPEPSERRLYQRYTINQTGSMILPAEEATLPCKVMNLGKTFGRVVRHHQDGISIQFIDTSRPPHGS
jgi:hypothetical protein